MKLYSGTSSQFVEDAIFNRIAGKLRSAFFAAYGFNPSEGEERSWRNSLRALSNVFQFAQFQTQGVLLEYQLPMTSRRLDCLVTGRSEDGKDQGVIIELKQWEESTESDGENEVLTYLGGGLRDVLHPSVQVGRYEMYLTDTHTAFYGGDSPVACHPAPTFITIRSSRATRSPPRHRAETSRRPRSARPRPSAR